MHPESDYQAVRRVLARAGITGAAAVLSVAAAMPAFAAAPHATAHGHAVGHDKAAQKAQNTAGAGAAGSNASGGSSTGSHDASAQAGSAQPAAAGHSDPQDDNGSQGSSDQNGSGASGGGTGGAASGDDNPPGNNGTVKIHDVAGDTSHHNVPHVSCDFYVDFWGFDAGQQLDVSFAGQAPTGMGTPVSFTALSPTGTSITSADEAGGGNDFDGELGFTASQDQLSVLGAPQPQQGYHVKLTVSTGAPGGYKYKVFWIQPCESETGGGVTPGTPGHKHHTHTPGTHHTHTPGTHTPGGSTTVLGEKVTRTFTTPESTQVLGTAATRPAAAAPTSLPFTGSEIAGMTLAGAAGLAGGAGLLLAARRRRRGPQHAES